MTPTNQQEAVANLHAICQQAAGEFEGLAAAAQLDALKMALQVRSAQCRRTAAALRPFVGSVADAAPEPVASAAPADDLERFRHYELREGQLLAAFRDTLDLPLDEGLATALVGPFERALDQYARLVELRRALLPAVARAAPAISPAHGAAALP